MNSPNNGTLNSIHNITITQSANESGAALEAFSAFDATTGATVPGIVNFVVDPSATLTIGQSFNSFGVYVTNQTTLGFANGTLQIDQGDITIGEDPTFDASNLTGLGTFNISSATVNFNNSTLFVGEGDLGPSTGFVTESGTSQVSGQNITIGDQGATGTYTLTGGTLTVSNNLLLASGTGSSGTFTQSAGTVTLGVGSQLAVGFDGTGTYTLEGSGSLQESGELIVGENTGSTGELDQSSGTLMADANSTVQIGSFGHGTYRLSGGTATFLSGISVGGVSGLAHGTGEFDQTNGTLTVGDTAVGGTDMQVGGAGAGTYNLSGGMATFNGGILVEANGTINQTGGTLIIPAGQTLDLSTVGSSYTLTGGVLEIGNNSTINGLTGTTGEGTLNFNGGILEVAAGTTAPVTDALDGTVTGSSVLNANNANLALTGLLTGAGGFTIQGANTVTLTVPQATYTGATFINGGNLVLALPGADTTDSFASPISGTTGSLAITDTAGQTLVLPGGINFTGTTNLGAGTVKIAGGTLGNIAATAANLEITSGTMNLTGTNQYTGTTTVDVGSTLLTGNLASTAVTNNGTFGFLTTTTVGAAPLTIGGTFTQTTGTLLERLAGPANDVYDITSGSLGGTVKVSGFAPIGTTTYNLVESSAGVTDAGLTVSSSGLITGSVAQVGNDLVLTITQAPLTSVAITPDEIAVANSLDAALTNPAGANNALFNALGNLSAAQIPAALDQLLPSSYLYMRNIQIENSTFLAEKVNGALSNLRNGFTGLDTSGLSLLQPGMESGLGRSLGSLLAYNNQGMAPNGVNYYPVDNEGSSSPLSAPMNPTTSPGAISDSPRTDVSPTVAPHRDPTVFDNSDVGFNEFISGDVVLADLSQNGTNSPQPKAHYTAGDGTAGVSFRMTNNLAMGVLFDYNHTDARVDGQDSHVRVDSYSPGVFATFFEKGFYANVLGTFGYNTYSNTRNMNFGGMSSAATSSPDGQTYMGDLNLGYDFHPDQHWTVGPTLEGQYTHVNVDSFQESGAGPADLAVGSQSADSVRTRLGGHVGYAIRSGTILFQPNLFAAWQHEFLDDAFNLTSQPDIVGATPFTIQGAKPGRDSALIGVGVSATLDNSMSLYLNYLAELGQTDYFVQSVEGGLKANF